MAQSHDVRDAGDRVERLLSELRSGPHPRVADVAEELVRTLVELYGAGLDRIVALVTAEGSAGAAMLERLAADPLVASLLLVHGLHPVDVHTRIQRALGRVRPYLGQHAGGVEYRGIDEHGVVRLRLEGTCHGCPASAVTVQSAIEGAIASAAPETTGVSVEGLVAPAAAGQLLQIGHRPPDDPCPVGGGGASVGGGEASVAGDGASVVADGASVGGDEASVGGGEASVGGGG